MVALESRYGVCGGVPKFLTLTPTMKATDYLAQFLADQKVECVFEMSGGMITHILDSIHTGGKVRIVSMHHEQGAAFAAEGFARMTGLPGVAFATSGPGATNLLTGVGSCYFDSTPAVFITGQVNRHEQKGDRAIRQLGFQETDIVSMVQPIAKAAWQVRTAEDFPADLERAFAIAQQGRPGPVLLDLPMDVQRLDVAAGSAKKTSRAAVQTVADPEFYDELFEKLGKASRPLILIGNGIRTGLATDECRRFLDLLKIPTVNSLMAVDVLPYNHPARVGMIGSYGNRWANLALASCDFLLVMGSRLDVRQTGADTDSFKARKALFHVDCDFAEMNNRVTGCRVRHQELSAFFAEALEHAAAAELQPKPAWIAEIAALRAQWPDTAEQGETPGVNPNLFMHELSRASQVAAAFIVDVGQHQMWAAQSLELGANQRFLTSGGMGSMGFALPAAIGACFGAKQQPIVVIAGDGGFQSNIQELQTVAREKLPLKIVIINNLCHGMVRQFQESYFEGRYQSTLWGYSAPDFEEVAKAYRIDARTVRGPTEVDAALEWLWSQPDTPALLQVMVDTQANAYPKMAFGRPISEMEPFATPLEMEGT